MTRDDIIRMAREAGICTGNSILLPAPDGQIEALDRFAALVAAAEREACVGIVDANVKACANNSMLQDVLKSNATAIRARGEV